MTDNELEQRIAEISFEYWYERALYERIGRQHISRDVKKVRKAAVGLLQVLDEVPYGGAAINRQMQMRAFSGGPKYSLKDMQEALQSLVSFCDRIPKISGRRGTREKHHVEATVEALVQLWSMLTEQAFIFTLDAAPYTGGRKAFVQPGPLFVQDMLEALDPPVDKSEGIDKDVDDATAAALKATDRKVIFEEAANALKKVSQSRKLSSENLPVGADFPD